VEHENSSVLDTKPLTIVAKRISDLYDQLYGFENQLGSIKLSDCGDQKVDSHHSYQKIWFR
jgi:hypothetical protein